MIKKIATVVCLLISVNIFAQKKIPGRELSVTVGTSGHGSGDLLGMAVSVDYREYFKKRLSYTVSLGTTIHDGDWPLFYQEPPGYTRDGSIRYTTAGLQLVSHLGYDLLQTKRHTIQFRLGALLRYQSSSYYDGVSVGYPPATGYPIPVVSFRNETPQRTYSLGASTQLAYSYLVTKKISLGVLAGFQFDTNGDTISQLSLTIGRRF